MFTYWKFQKDHLSRLLLKLSRVQIQAKPVNILFHAYNIKKVKV